MLENYLNQPSSIGEWEPSELAVVPWVKLKGQKISKDIPIIGTAHWELKDELKPYCAYWTIEETPPYESLLKGPLALLFKVREEQGGEKVEWYVKVVFDENYFLWKVAEGLKEAGLSPEKLKTKLEDIYEEIKKKENEIAFQEAAERLKKINPDISEEKIREFLSS